MSQKLIGAPVFGQLNRASADVAVILLQLGFKSAEERKRIRSRTRETRQNLVLIQPPYFLRRMFNHAFAKRDLPISGHDYVAIPANTQNCSGANQALLRHDRQTVIIAAKRHLLYALVGLFASNCRSTY